MGQIKTQNKIRTGRNLPRQTGSDHTRPHMSPTVLPHTNTNCPHTTLVSPAGTQRQLYTSFCVKAHAARSHRALLTQGTGVFRHLLIWMHTVPPSSDVHYHWQSAIRWQGGPRHHTATPTLCCCTFGFNYSTQSFRVGAWDQCGKCTFWNYVQKVQT